MNLFLGASVAGTLAALLIAGGLSTLLISGCAPSREPAAGGGELIPDGAVFNYTVSECNCQEYTAKDRRVDVSFTFSAKYRMEDGILTEISVTVGNGTRDTVQLGRGSVKVSSRNIRYQYNDKFVPLPDLMILPGSSEELTFTGAEVTDSPDWRRIAGEQMTFTVSRIRLGEVELANQVATFIPENPLLLESKQKSNQKP